MPAYLTRAEAVRLLGDRVAGRLFPDESAIDEMIERASVHVQRAHRNKARDGSALLGETTTDPFVVEATWCAFYELACLIPGSMIKLPEGWEEMPPRKALDAIRKGELQTVAETTPVIAEAIKSTPVTFDAPKTTTQQIGRL